MFRRKVYLKVFGMVVADRFYFEARGKQVKQIPKKSLKKSKKPEKITKS